MVHRQPPHDPNHPTGPGTPPGGHQPPPQGYPQPGHPHPGYPQPGVQPPTPPKRNWFARHKIITTLLVIVATIIVISAVANGSDESATPTTGPTAVDDGTATAPGNGAGTDKKAAGRQPKKQSAEKPAAGVGDTVRAGDLELTVDKVACGKKRVGNEYLGQTAQGQFCILTVDLSNSGDGPLTISDSDFSLYDSRGRKFAADTEAMITNDESSDIWLEEINPGNTVSGALIFDIPRGADASRLELSSSDLFGEPAVVRL